MRNFARRNKRKKIDGSHPLTKQESEFLSLRFFVAVQGLRPRIVLFKRSFSPACPDGCTASLHRLQLYLFYWTCSGTRLVSNLRFALQVLHFFGLGFFKARPTKMRFIYGSCSETEVSEQLYYLFYI